MAAFKFQLDPRPALHDADGEAWRALIESRCGIHFSQARTHQLESALRKRMQETGAASYFDYYRMVNSDRRPGEWNALLEAITNHETCFFRHAPTFRVLEEELLPRLAKAAAGRVEAALWSAGCSTGEEAYSAAMSCLSASQKYARLGCSVLASDISQQALDTADAAVYNARSASGIPDAFRAYLVPQPGARFRVAPDVRALVKLSKVNLTQPETYPAAMFDVILCQNVFVYFRPPAAQQVLDGLASRLKPGGCLLPGPGEIAGLHCSALRCVSLGDVQIFLKPSAERA